MLTLKSDNIARMTRTTWEPVPDWRMDAAKECLFAAPGVAIIEQQPDYSSLLMQIGNNSMRDVHSNRQIYRDWKEQSTGTILAIGPDFPLEDPFFAEGRKKALAGSQFLHETLKVGDRVLFRWWWSVAIRNYTVADPEKGWYFGSDHLRFFGRATRLKNRDDLSSLVPYSVPLHELIMAHLEFNENDELLDLPIRPYKHWVLGLRDPLNEESEGGIILTDTLTNRKPELTIIRMGDECCLGAKAGQRWCYTIEAQELVHLSVPGLDRRVVLIPEEALLTRCAGGTVDPEALWMEAHARICP